METITREASETIKEANKLIEQVEGYLPKLLDFAVNLVIAVIIFIIGRLLIKLVLKLLNKFFIRSKIEVSVQKFLDSLIKAGLYIILLIIICAQVGIETTSFLAVIGSIGLAIGLALQGSLSNFAGGVLILILKPFKVGDYIKSGNGEEGTVNKIDLFYTSIVTGDNVLIIVPNASLANNTIVNSSVFGKRRMDVSFAISKTSDVAKTKEVIYSMLNKHGKVLKGEELFVFVKELAGNQIIMEFRAWFASEDFGDAGFSIMEEVKAVLDENQIEMPGNQVEVFINHQ